MVHQYQLNGYNIVLDSCSGSVHVVDDVAYDVIAMYKEHSADEIVAAMLAKYADRPPATSTAPTASPRRAAIRATAP